MNLLAVGTILALVVVSALLAYTVRAIPHLIPAALPDPHPQPTTKQLMEFGLQLERNERDIADLRLAVDHGIARVDRAEKRIQKTVTSARRLLREEGLEHAGIEAEYEQLQPGDAGPGDSDPMLPLYEEVEAPTRTGIPGLNSDELQQIRERLNV